MSSPVNNIPYRKGLDKHFWSSIPNLNNPVKRTGKTRGLLSLNYRLHTGRINRDKTVVWRTLYPLCQKIWWRIIHPGYTGWMWFYWGWSRTWQIFSYSGYRMRHGASYPWTDKAGLSGHGNWFIRIPAGKGPGKSTRSRTGNWFPPGWCLAISPFRKHLIWPS